jgi:hypothetical protein
MAWITLTTDDILNSLTSQEQGLMNDPSSAVDLANIVSGVIALVRGKVITYQPNQTQTGPAGTIPEELHAAATAISRFKFLTHLPGTQLITKWREEENVTALAQLDAAANGTLLVQGAVPPIDISALTPQKQAISGGEPYFPPYGTWGTPWWNQPYWSGAGPYW